MTKHKWLSACIVISAVLLLVSQISSSSGKPAARKGDQTTHGGSIVQGFSSVLIGGKPAARIGDNHTCPMMSYAPHPIPHVGGPILTGSKSVLIGGKSAARVGDQALCQNSPPDTIHQGCPTVLIGD